MTFHKEGISSLLVTILFGAILNAGIYALWPEVTIVKIAGYVVSGVLLIIILQFFRSPSRTAVLNKNQILSPADGKVVVIEEVEETEYFKDKRRQISIFMSPVNVHINWYPLSGIISYLKYHPGKYLVAYHPKSSMENERSTLVVKHTNGVEVLFRQVAGALARRIVYYGKEGDVVEQGDQFGFIKFGSRIDIFLPLTAKVEVELEQKVKGTQSVIATF